MPIKAGFAQAVITPELGSEMPGMGQKRFADSVHDDLYATAMVLDTGQGAVALVGVDALSVKRSMVLATREEVEERTGIPGDHVMVAASHTHNGGPTCEAFLSESDPDYCALVARKCADAVIEAWERREDAVMKIGSGHQEGIAFNRRFRMRGGVETTHPGQGNPDIIEPAGPIDPEVGVIGAFSTDGKRFLGCFVNYTCHCTLGVGGAGYSADYVYYLRKTIVGAMENEDAVVVFGNGACGDVTQVDNRRQDTSVSEFGEEWGRFVGNSIAGEAIKVLSQVDVVDDSAIGADSTLVDLRPRELDAARVAEARAVVAARTGDKWTGDEVAARELVLLDQMNCEEPVVTAEVQALRIGTAAIVSSPAEYFCQFGLDIKAQSPHVPTYVVELANGCVGYLPGFEQVIKEEGYEPKTCRSSKLSPEAGEQIANAAIALVNG